MRQQYHNWVVWSRHITRSRAYKSSRLKWNMERELEGYILKRCQEPHFKYRRSPCHLAHGATSRTPFSYIKSQNII